jgi:hypothetical protein
MVLYEAQMIESENLKQWEHCKLYEQMIEDVTMKSSATESTLPTSFLSNRAWVFGTFLCVLLLLSLSGCSEPTVGQQFRDIMAEIDAKCRKEGIGPYLSPDEPPRSRKRTDSSCDILKIKPTDPLATEEGRFAYSIQLPPPHDKPKVEYKKGMSAEAYFKELCEKEAGEWIFKTVEGVEGVFQGRRNIPPAQSGDSLLVHPLREASEITRTMEDVLVQPYHGRYNYMERPRDLDETGAPYFRDFRGKENTERFPSGFTVNVDGSFRKVPYIVNREYAEKLKSEYAFSWRQVVHTDMLENGIVSGETIIYDRTTIEVLAFRRFVVRYWPLEDSMSTRLVNRESCRPGFTGASSDFIQAVLVPVNPVRRGKN